MLLLARKERLDRASPVLLASQALPFFVPFCFAKRWTIEFESLLFILLFTKKRYQGKILDTFSGAEGETRQGQALSCLLRKLSHFLSLFASQKDGLSSSSLSCLFCYSQRKGIKEKSLIPFLARKERLELSRRFPDLRP